MKKAISGIRGVFFRNGAAWIRFIDENGKLKARTALPAEHEHIYEHFVHGLSMQFETIMINRKRIPRDLLHFSHDTYPFVFVEMLVKLFKYGKFANLVQHLYYHRGLPAAPSRLSKTGELYQSLSVWFKSFTLYNYRPSLTGFLQPLADRTRAVFR